MENKNTDKAMQDDFASLTTNVSFSIVELVSADKILKTKEIYKKFEVEISILKANRNEILIKAIFMLIGLCDNLNTSISSLYEVYQKYKFSQEVNEEKQKEKTDLVNDYFIKKKQKFLLQS